MNTITLEMRYLRSQPHIWCEIKTHESCLDLGNENGITFRFVPFHQYSKALVLSEVEDVLGSSIDENGR